jgi:hypothetical protein
MYQAVKGPGSANVLKKNRTVKPINSLYVTSEKKQRVKILKQHKTMSVKLTCQALMHLKKAKTLETLPWR